MRNHTETGAGRVALVGVLAALSLIALYLSAVSPTARMGIVAIAGLFPAGAVVSAGLKAGFFCYGAAGLLGLLLVPDKAFLPETLQAPWMVYAAGNAAFVIYDVGFSKLISFYVARVDRVLRKTS